MKNATGCVVLCLLAWFGTAQAQSLKIDFGVTGSPVETDFQAYTATHEVANTFTPQSFEAFGTTITVALTWPSGPENTAMQMFDRTTDGRYAYTGEHGDLLRDWTGTDGRVANANPLVLTLSGLPKGNYSWLSYHHDGIDQTGVFSATVHGGAGTVTTADLPITNSAGGDNITDFASVATFATEFTSNGQDDVVFEFTLTSSSATLTTAFFVMNGLEIELLSALNVAQNPNPSDGQTDVSRDIVLSWTPMDVSVTHDVYFGQSREDVNAAGPSGAAGVHVSPGQDANLFDPGRLEFGTTYYWRVDEVNATPDKTVFKGDVWSFTIEPLYYTVEDVTAIVSVPTAAGSGGPEVIVDGSGLIDGLHGTVDGTMWSGKGAEGDPVWLQFDFDRVYKLYGMLVWNYNGQFEYILGFGLKDVTIEYATEPNEWITLDDYELTRGTNLPDYAGQQIDLGGLAARSIRINVNSTHSGGLQTGLSEIRFLYKPVVASEPQPADGQTEVDINTTLTWRPGREAASHQVHLGADSNAVADGAALLDTVAANAYALPTLDLGTTYYWKIVEVNEAETPATWASDVWSFSTPEYFVVDDFEDYTDDTGEEIFSTWADGYNDNSNGSQVGHDTPPYAEETIVHSGGQAMPLRYGQDGATTSEATMTLPVAEDWARGGATTLVVHFYGDISNSPVQLYVKINGTKVQYHDNSALTKPWWTQWNIDLASIPGGVKAVGALAIGVSGSGTGTLYVDDIRLYKSAPAGATEQLWTEAESATALPAPWTTTDEPLASGGKYVMAPSTATASTTNPSTTDVATYTFTVAGGQYRLWFRLGPVIGYDNDSFWVRIADATSMDPTGNADNPGWVRVNGLAGQAGADTWHWGWVWDDEHGSQQVTFTLPAGTHTLEVSYRELEVPLDLILITNDLELQR
ncbi:MAG: discoidin domain-containing protein [Sedimentisphaerales bacterium]|nr:discoidin domain-containing protein [Sedimentisphaerales bacterium]